MPRMTRDRLEEEEFLVFEYTVQDCTEFGHTGPYTREGTGRRVSNGKGKFTAIEVTWSNFAISTHPVEHFWRSWGHLIKLIGPEKPEEKPKTAGQRLSGFAASAGVIEGQPKPVNLEYPNGQQYPVLPHGVKTIWVGPDGHYVPSIEVILAMPTDEYIAWTVSYNAWLTWTRANAEAAARPQEPSKPPDEEKVTERVHEAYIEAYRQAFADFHERLREISSNSTWERIDTWVLDEAEQAWQAGNSHE